jgi:putative DNA methylase
MTTHRKLIEVALPLEAINRESAREKSIRHGHPSTLHLWWARRPLAACRAVIFASIVDDPSSHPEQFPTEASQDAERQRLFRLIEELVKWENVNNEEVLGRARAEILKATDGNPPPLLDPFAGGGSIPLEAQRLGLEAHASDLNPVAVLINKALIEIPPKFAGRPPVHPDVGANGRSPLLGRDWRGAEGLAEDVRYYGQWMRDEAERRIGRLYPKVKLPGIEASAGLPQGWEKPPKGSNLEKGGGEATVIAWLWARTVRCPNPACGAQMPLVRSFALSTKAGKQAWVEPIVDRSQQPPIVRFEVRTGIGKPREGTVNRRGATCLCCGTPTPLSYVRLEAQDGRMGTIPLAIVADSPMGRIYLPPDSEHEKIARSAQPRWKPEERVTTPSHDVDRLPMYGMYTWGDAFTPRQLVALTTFSDLVGEARERVRCDAIAAGLPDDGVLLEEGGITATAYADAIATYLAFALDKGVDYWSSICSWHSSGEKMRNTFGRQAIAMVWDYAECCPFSNSTGNWLACIEWVWKVIAQLPCRGKATVLQLDAISAQRGDASSVISTDPPYYDNIGYADLSDFFYVWLRRSLVHSYSCLFSTLLVPKAQELVATPYRFGGSKERAQQFFETGLGEAFKRMRERTNPDYPLTIYYAFKQAEFECGDNDGPDTAMVVASTGWETMLEGLIRSDFQITGTWPMRTELGNRIVADKSNALASSIVLVCRPRPDDAPLTTRRDFLNALKRELPAALRDLQRGNIAPVDLAQASIGPGMAIYSRYRRVLEADGAAMTVRTALALINQALDAYLAEQEGEYDADTRWALAWFEQFGFEEGPFGDAETLSKAKNTSVGGMVEAGILAARGGKVRLLRREELPADWDPGADRRLTVWEVAQQLIRTMQERGEPAAAALLSQVGGLGDVARDLAYRLYTICERKGWSSEALPYNGLVVAWSEVGRLAVEQPKEMPMQGGLFDS